MSLASPVRAATTPSGAAPVAGASPATAGTDDPSLQEKPVDVAILVDESGSESPTDVAQEVNAATILALGQLSGLSTVSVTGFGSSERQGQSAVGPLCPPTGVDTQDRLNALLVCIGRLHPRTADEGNNTDFVAAISQALYYLRQSDGDRPKMIFLLTDGKLDVHLSSQYGAAEEDRNAAAGRQLTDELAQARETGVQVWPLGFGDVDAGALQSMAEQGAQRTCSDLSGDAKPRATIVRTSADALTSLAAAYASARCAQYTVQDGNLQPGGPPVELKVNIPEISTDGSFVVLKGDPSVQVTYIDPLGRSVGDQTTVDGSTFTRGPQGGTTDSLRVANPRAGTWTIRLTPGAETTKPTRVVAAAVWQGVVRSSIVVDPPSPRPGQKVNVSVRLRSRNGDIKDPAALKGVTVGARMSGNFAEQNLSLRDDGKAPDTAAGDGVYSGTFAVPSNAKGVLTFVGTVRAPGVLTDERAFSAEVGTGAAPVLAAIDLRSTTVKPGGSVSGTITLTNQDGQPHRLRLVLDDLSPGTLAQLSPRNVVITSGGPGRTEQHFTIVFDPKTKLGTGSGTARLVDADQPATTYAQSFFGEKISYPEARWKQLWWLYLIGFGALAALVVLVSRLVRVRQMRADVRGLVMQLYRGDRLVHYMKAPPTPSSRMAFAIRNTDSEDPTLERVRDGEVGYVVRRGDAGDVRLTRPDGRVLQLARRGRVSVGAGLDLGFEDSRLQEGREDRAGMGAGGSSSGEDRWSRSSDDDRWGASGGDHWGAGDDRGDSGGGRWSHGDTGFDDDDRDPGSDQRGATGRPGWDRGTRPGRGRDGGRREPTAPDRGTRPSPRFDADTPARDNAGDWDSGRREGRGRW